MQVQKLEKQKSTFAPFVDDLCCLNHVKERLSRGEGRQKSYRLVAEIELTESEYFEVVQDLASRREWLIGFGGMLEGDDQEEIPPTFEGIMAWIDAAVLAVVEIRCGDHQRFRVFCDNEGNPILVTMLLENWN